jgi:hypothetical protein
LAALAEERSVAAVGPWIVIGIEPPFVHSRVPDQPPLGDADRSGPDSLEPAAVKKTAEAFVKAFNSGNAKAVVAFSTANGGYIGPDGETIRGRPAHEKEYLEVLQEASQERVPRRSDRA